MDAQVKRAVLEEVIEQHPARLTVKEVTLRVAANPDDPDEREAITEAIRDLRRSDVLRYRDDDLVVEPTHAAVCTVALLF